jgi:hypothetical protein
MRAFLIAVAAIAALAAPAAAQPKKPAAPVPATNLLVCDPLKLLPGCASIAGSVTSNLGDLWQKIIAASGPDLAYAKAMADAAATPGSKLRSACYAAIILVNSQTSGANLGAMPNPNVITQAEQAAELIDSLQPTSAVIAGCAPAANAVALSVTQLLNILLAAVAVVPK